MESCLPPKYHYFSVGKFRSSLFIREEAVLLEEDFATPQQQKDVRKWSKKSSKQTPATQKYSEPDQTFSAGLGVGSPVQLIQDPNRTGVIKWIGPLPEIKGTIAGVELVSMRENYIIIMIVLFLSSGWSYGRL